MRKCFLVVSFLVASTFSEANYYFYTQSFHQNTYNISIDTTYSIRSINVKKAQKIIHQNINNTQFVILDVRTANEYNSSHISNAINLNFKSSSFQEDLDKLDKSKTYLVYCTAGYRSMKTSQLMKEKRFTSIYNMKGGMMKWKTKNLPVDEPKP